ncbi:MAG: 2-oxoacid:acceptor oxidoreductase family protein [Crenarchaeota archaeon]|nr:2-oxoacid:acceptor oxidoreductase family protein [Thermoproteota archaeon]MCR8453385.1 2-oxoacid:acceptor oxidoreductase family protein [Thermoproteota archaeon]MCR8455711.1 2-oxoacid:acceptor oxidoreductase family protein [Thermoproteota archaeon]MCR8462548.1 2-oxoacid:acceptor oxidoreductase family protein [Thermoproteota archaeon]MCR8470724.1 2-oxoacid:acceptor oxidoreductase family protein [Thermoproteota archaeon]
MQEDKPFEIVFLARGGQGAWTSSILIAQAALRAGKYAQSFPEFGPERSGAPVKAYARIHDKPIEIHAGITQAEIVAVVDGTLSHMAKDFIRDKGAIVINTSESPAELKKKLGIPESVKIYTVDGTRIALETLKRPIANTAILGSVIKVLEELGVKYLSLNDLIYAVREVLGGRYSEAIVKGNIDAVERAYKEVRGE